MHCTMTRGREGGEGRGAERQERRERRGEGGRGRKGFHGAVPLLSPSDTSRHRGGDTLSVG